MVALPFYALVCGLWEVLEQIGDEESIVTRGLNQLGEDGGDRGWCVGRSKEEVDDILSQVGGGSASGTSIVM